MLTWGGLRGACRWCSPLALAAGAFRTASSSITMTFGVVVVSILVQGLTMAPLLRVLGIVGEYAARTAYETKRGTLQAADAALAEDSR